MSSGSNWGMAVAPDMAVNHCWFRNPMAYIFRDDGSGRVNNSRRLLRVDFGMSASCRVRIKLGSVGVSMSFPLAPQSRHRLSRPRRPFRANPDVRIDAARLRYLSQLFT
jgi:hypothetical protein